MWWALTREECLFLGFKKCWSEPKVFQAKTNLTIYHLGILPKWQLEENDSGISFNWQLFCGGYWGTQASLDKAERERETSAGTHLGYCGSKNQSLSVLAQTADWLSFLIAEVL